MPKAALNCAPNSWKAASKWLASLMPLCCTARMWPEISLTCPDARRIKSLVGGELLDCEFKGSNIRATIEGVFNILISSNARLRLYIDSDRSAWERGLIDSWSFFP